MNLNEKKITEIARQLGITDSKRIDKSTISRLSSKSDVELEREILRLKSQLKASNISSAQQIALLKSIEPMMDDQQRMRLARIIEILRK